MIPISRIVKCVSGTPQFRIKESFGKDVPTYIFYSQSEIDDALSGLDTSKDEKKLIRTFDKVNTVEAGDVIFSLISGKAAIVRSDHAGYLFTQNYVVLIPTESIDAGYLVYILNENREIKYQFQKGRQGSSTLKCTLGQLNSLVFPDIPVIEKQRVLGELYFNQLKREALKNRVAANETTFLLQIIKEVTQA